MAPNDLWYIIGTALADAFGTVPGSTTKVTETGWIVLTGEPVADFNMLLVDAGPNPAGQLRELTALLLARDLPGLVFLTAVVADQLAPVARDLDLKPGGQVPVMLYQPTDEALTEEAGPPAQERFQIERVTTETLGDATRLAADTFEVAEDVFARAYSPAILAVPGVMVFLARDGDEPVSTVTTMATGATVGVWTMATRPSRQRQGAGKALLEHALSHHQAHGAERFYLLATAAGKPLYERVGFRTVSEVAVWVRGTSVQVPSG
jgi:GNAT superfamily N-acetyltransferase